MNLLLHIRELEVELRALGGPIDLGSDKEHGFSLEVISGEIIAFLETFGGAKQAHHIEIKDRMSVKMIPHGGRVALEKEKILQTKGSRIEKLRLKGQAVSIGTGEIADHFNSFLLQEGACRE
jgi:hypothetical protein